MNISIPDKLKGWAEQRVAEGRYSSTSDYVRDLVRRDQENEERLRRLQAAIDEGRASGVSEHDPFEYLEQLRRLQAVIDDGRASGVSKRGIADIVADRRKQDGLE